MTNPISPLDATLLALILMGIIGTSYFIRGWAEEQERFDRETAARSQLAQYQYDERVFIPKVVISETQVRKAANSVLKCHATVEEVSCV